jgi:hypothetical protein
VEGQARGAAAILVTDVDALTEPAAATSQLLHAHAVIAGNSLRSPAILPFNINPNVATPTVNE